MMESRRIGTSSLETEQTSNEAARSFSSDLKAMAESKNQIDAWARHATASNGFADIGANPAP